MLNKKRGGGGGGGRRNVDGDKLSDLRFADDEALSTERIENIDLDYHLDIVNEESLKVDFRRHTGQAKLMPYVDKRAKKETTEKRR